ncbi:MAG: L,D-transpeptidase family protein, partial [Hyphomicrobium sp.]
MALRRLAKVASFALAPLLLLFTAAGPGWSTPKDTEPSPAEPALAGPAVLAVVSIYDQRISVYDAEGRAMRARVSSGQTDYETPVGIYSILQKNRDHYSNLYDDAEMPFMQRLTWSGIALHAGALPGYPASHGCVRLPRSFADGLFGLTSVGMRVIVAGEDVAPSPITHAKLWKPAASGFSATTPIAYEPDEDTSDSGKPFQPDLRKWPERQALLDSLKEEAAAKVPAAEAAAKRVDELKKVEKAKTAARAKTAKALKRAERNLKSADDWVKTAARKIAEARTAKRRTAAEKDAAKAAENKVKAEKQLADAQVQDQAPAADLARATQDRKAADAAKTAAVTEAQEAKRKTLPVSVFVSLKTQRLYIRQGHEPVLDVPVTIAAPEKEIGTHIFTAMDYAGNGGDVKWNVVSLRPRPMARVASADVGDEDYASSRKKKRRQSEPLLAPPATDLGPATAALDRVTFPPEVLSRVSAYVWPGTSLIISDEPISKETNKATDF